MFGTNPVSRDETHKDGASLAVHSTFVTVQGEGPFAGQKCIFVRLGGCNLRCFFCDTEFTNGVQEVETARLSANLASQLLAMKWHDPPLVVITGGEPLRQNIAPLCNALLASVGNIRIQIETAGTLMPNTLLPLLALPDSEGTGLRRPGVYIVCSPKTPIIHRDVGARVTAWKYLISADDVDDEDGLPFRRTQVRRDLDRDDQRAHIARPWTYQRRPVIYVQPLDANNAEKNAANMSAAINSSLRHGYRFSIQMHKYAGVE